MKNEFEGEQERIYGGVRREERERRNDVVIISKIKEKILKNSIAQYLLNKRNLNLNYIHRII